MLWVPETPEFLSEWLLRADVCPLFESLPAQVSSIPGMCIPGPAEGQGAAVLGWSSWTEPDGWVRECTHSCEKPPQQATGSGEGHQEGRLLVLIITVVPGGCDIINLCTLGPTFSSTFNPSSCCVCVCVCVCWGCGEAHSFSFSQRG